MLRIQISALVIPYRVYNIGICNVHTEQLRNCFETPQRIPNSAHFFIIFFFRIFPTNSASRLTKVILPAINKEYQQIDEQQRKLYMYIAENQPIASEREQNRSRNQRKQFSLPSKSEAYSYNCSCACIFFLKPKEHHLCWIVMGQVKGQVHESTSFFSVFSSIWQPFLS